MTRKTGLLIPAERIQQCIYLIRKQKVMLDKDLADLYGVTTKRLNEQVQRNIDRFPFDFMFQLNDEEAKILRSQIATSKKAVAAGDIILVMREQIGRFQALYGRKRDWRNTNCI